jgi:hypothetical protein
MNVYMVNINASLDEAANYAFEQLPMMCNILRCSYCGLNINCMTRLVLADQSQ